MDSKAKEDWSESGQPQTWVSLAQIPYFVWVSLATVLQLSITVMNWGRP